MGRAVRRAAARADARGEGGVPRDAQRGDTCPFGDFDAVIRRDPARAPPIDTCLIWQVSLASDAFFPFRDSLDVASTRGVKYVVAAGGSVADAEVNRRDVPRYAAAIGPILAHSWRDLGAISVQVIGAADEYGMAMAFSGVRLFHH